MFSRVHLRLADLASDRGAPRRGRGDDRQRCIGAVAGYFRGLRRRSPACAAADLVFAFPAIILAMVVDRGARPRPAERRARDRHRRVAVVRARRARARPLGRRLGVRPVRRGCSARRRRTLCAATCCRTSPGPCSSSPRSTSRTAILLLSGLSFLGLGAQPPTPEWGSMVAEGTQYFQWWWIGTFPGLAIFTVVRRVQLHRRQPARRVRPADRAAGRGRPSREPARGRGPARAAADARRAGHGRRRRRLRGRAGRGVRDRGRERQRQDDLDAGAARPAPRALLGRRARARFDGRDLLAAAAKAAARDLRPRAGDGLSGPVDLAPPDALDRTPAHRARRRQHRARAGGAADKRAAELLADVRIPDPEAALRAYPHQFSGGMRQRIAIAIALACAPKLLIADEPTTALDVTVQAGILRLLDRLRREHGLAVVLITHDLGVLSAIADRVVDLLRRPGRRVGLARGRAPAAAASVHACAPRRVAASGGGAARSRSSRSAARRRARPASRRAVPSIRAARIARDDCRVEVPPLVQVGGRRLACPVDPFAPMSVLELATSSSTTSGAAAGACAQSPVRASPSSADRSSGSSASPGCGKSTPRAGRGRASSRRRRAPSTSRARR